MKPVLLCYHLTGDKGSKILFTAMRLGVRLRPVQPEEYSQTLNALCGLAPMDAPSYEGEDFADEMLVMGNFSDRLIDQFLEGLRRTKAPRVALKAILTDANGGWDSITLHRELSEERAAVLASRQSAHAPEKG